jgi:hypothetical protein
VNQRIRELAEQAGYKPLSPPTFADELNEIFMRKFAELIVEECARIVPDTDLEDVEGGDSAVLMAASKQIKKHFGVE